MISVGVNDVLCYFCFAFFIHLRKKCQGTPELTQRDNSKNHCFTPPYEIPVCWLKPFSEWMQWLITRIICFSLQMSVGVSGTCCYKLDIAFNYWRDGENVTAKPRVCLYCTLQGVVHPQFLDATYLSTIDFGVEVQFPGILWRKWSLVSSDACFSN